MTSLAAKLAGVDWDFAEANTRNGPHAIHPYPGKFIPQIPRTLIELIRPNRRLAILDPFCGSGTALLEATLAGYQSVGIDSNPLACLIAKVKCCALAPSAVTVVSNVVNRARLLLRSGDVCVPHLPKLDHWFQSGVQPVISSLLMSIGQLPDRDVRDALRIALSSIIVRVSNQESDTRYAAVDKSVAPNEVFGLFAAKARSLIASLSNLQANLFGSLPRPEILHKNILSVTPKDIRQRIGLVITSPPYPNAYEYWLYHKYRMYWLGMDPIAARETEIGARPHYFKKNHQTAEDFERQMDTVFGLLSSVMKRGAHACFLISSSVIHNQEIDNLALLNRSGARSGFQSTAAIARRIPRTRKAFNPVHGRIDQESIAVFTLR